MLNGGLARSLPEGQKIGFEVGMQVVPETIGVARAEIGVNPPNGEIHPGQFPGGGACARPLFPILRGELSEGICVDSAEQIERARGR